MEPTKALYNYQTLVENTEIRILRLVGVNESNSQPDTIQENPDQQDEQASTQDSDATLTEKSNQQVEQTELDVNAKAATREKPRTICNVITSALRKWKLVRRKSMKKSIKRRLSRASSMPQKHHTKAPAYRGTPKALPFRCRIEHVDMATSVPFTALSYVWGDPEQSHWIEVEDEQGQSVGWIPLTKNLHSAMSDLWRSSEVDSKVFWIDQICIDQSNLSEKGHQVQYMGSIYKAAGRVVTYAGPEEEGDEEAIEMFWRVHNFFEPYYETSDLVGKPIGHYTLHGIPEHLQFNYDPKRVAHLQRASEFVRGEWLSRLWMVQENIANKETFLLCGPYLIPLDGALMFTTLEALELIGEFPPKAVNCVEQAIILHGSRRRVHFAAPGEVLIDKYGYKWPRLHDLVRLFSPKAACQDPRDKIYALFSAATDRDEIGLSPDYCADSEKVFIEYASLSIKKTDGFNVLRNSALECHYDDIDDSSEPQNQLNLPSWVPDFSKNPKVIWDGTPAGSTKPDYSFSEDLRTLKVRGLRCSTVKKIYGTVLGDIGLTSSGNIQDTHEIFKKLLDDLGNTDLANALGAYLIVDEFKESSMDQPEAAKAMKGLRKVIDFSVKKDISSVDGSLRLFFDKVPSADVLLPKYLLAHGNIDDRTISLTADNRPCKSNAEVKEGDLIVNFLGGGTLYALRPAEDGQFIFVGQATIPGLMDGQQIENDPEWESKVEEFQII
jgi:Heterokaryon incompatibility protein (HET)